MAKPKTNITTTVPRGSTSADVKRVRVGRIKGLVRGGKTETVKISPRRAR